MDHPKSPEEALDAAGATVRPFPKFGYSGRLRVLTPAECVLIGMREYLVKGLLARGDHAVLFGVPGAGKSILAPHLAYAVAQARMVFGRRVCQAPVLYLAAEDGKGLAARIRALRERHGEAPDLHLVPDALNLMDRDGTDHGEVMELVRRIRPGLIVLDTLAAAFDGLRENDSDQMDAVVRTVRQLAAIAGSAVLVVHHGTKDGGDTPRGHGRLNGDADVTLRIDGAGSGPRTVRMGKNRNGASDASFTFNLEVVTLGVDVDGDPITAPIAVEVEPGTGTRVDRLAAKEARLSDHPAVFLRELRSLIAECGEPAQPVPDMPPVTTVSRRTLRERLVDRGWFSEAQLRNTPESSSGVNDSGYKMENSSLTTLKRNGFLAFTKEVVWLL